VSRLIFVPSCLIGARVMISKPPSDGETAIVTFNARSSGVRSGKQSEIVGRMYPSLRALADETRLHIVEMLREEELYAQQIVDRLEQSQSTVSRHLSLLVAGGVLSVRKEAGMKFYRVNEPSMARLAEWLQGTGRET